MICPACHEHGQRSRVYVHSSVRTAMGVQRYYDEDGKFVVDDPNTTTITWHCSNGHDGSAVTRQGHASKVDVDLTCRYPTAPPRAPRPVVLSLVGKPADPTTIATFTMSGKVRL